MALDDLNKSVKLEPQNASVYISRGYLYKTIGKIYLAKADFITAIEFSTRNRIFIRSMINEIEKLDEIISTK